MRAVPATARMIIGTLYNDLVGNKAIYDSNISQENFPSIILFTGLALFAGVALFA